MVEATITSGQRLPLPNTPAAASSTARLPMAAFLEQIHTERISRPRCGSDSRCVHGGLRKNERDAAIAALATGEVQILCA
jgi:hypothetical protein